MELFIKHIYDHCGVSTASVGNNESEIVENFLKFYDSVDFSSWEKINHLIVCRTVVVFRDENFITHDFRKCAQDLSRILNEKQSPKKPIPITPQAPLHHRINLSTGWQVRGHG